MNIDLFCEVESQEAEENHEQFDGTKQNSLKDIYKNVMRTVPQPGR